MTLKFKLGPLENLKNLPFNPGTIYLTNDSHEMFYDRDEIRNKITNTNFLKIQISESIFITEEETNKNSILGKLYLGKSKIGTST